MNQVTYGYEGVNAPYSNWNSQKLQNNLNLDNTATQKAFILQFGNTGRLQSVRTKMLARFGIGTICPPTKAHKSNTDGWMYCR